MYTVNTKSNRSMVSLLQEQLDKCEGTSFDVFEYMSKYTLDNLLQCICSYKSDVQTDG